MLRVALALLACTIAVSALSTHGEHQLETLRRIDAEYDTNLADHYRGPDAMMRAARGSSTTPSQLYNSFIAGCGGDITYNFALTINEDPCSGLDQISSWSENIYTKSDINATTDGGTYLYFPPYVSSGGDQFVWLAFQTSVDSDKNLPVILMETLACGVNKGTNWDMDIEKGSFTHAVHDTDIVFCGKFDPEDGCHYAELDDWEPSSDSNIERAGAYCMESSDGKITHTMLQFETDQHDFVGVAKFHEHYYQSLPTTALGSLIECNSFVNSISGGIENFRGEFKRCVSSASDLAASAVVVLAAFAFAALF